MAGVAGEAGAVRVVDGSRVECYYQGQVWREIGDLQTSRGKHAEAEAALRRALEGLDGPNEDAGRDLEHDEILAAVLRDLAATCRKLGKEDEARTLLDRARAREAGEAPARRPAED